MMKTILTTAFLAVTLIAAPVQAEDMDETRMLACKQMDKLSRTIMTFRQEGASMAEKIEMIEKMREESMSKGDTAALDDSITLVRAAYKTPRYRTEENKTRAVEDFANDVYAKCLESFD